MSQTDWESTAMTTASPWIREPSAQRTAVAQTFFEDAPQPSSVDIYPVDVENGSYPVGM